VYAWVVGAQQAAPLPSISELGSAKAGIFTAEVQRTQRKAESKLVSGAGKQQQIPVRIFDDEILGAPRLLFQFLVKGDPGGLIFKKQ
jgi:hypothetical protein